ncbi:hypothetical protein [Saccharopolyspora hattusasensis]|uniref:hypothetical protein n=1 Tax=Saccharopolyspora hattusasensis TaxID=1128679 RepID=UPI003D9887DE
MLRPAGHSARGAAFAAITPTTELVHPFPKHEEPGRETGSPEEGWFVSPERADFLNLGESHIRE